MNVRDRQICTALQFAFPLATRPYLSIARAIGCGEKEVISRIARLKRNGIIRQISAIFDSSKIGYQSTLAAFKVKEERLEQVAHSLSALPEVSHNYQREGDFNLWFTVTIPAGKDLRSAVKALARNAGVQEWLFLPTVRRFKISFRLPMSTITPSTRPARVPTDPTPVTVDAAIVNELQKDLPLCARPFRKAARNLGMTEGGVCALLLRYIESGAARRFAAVLRQVKAGFAANVMVAWSPSAARKAALGTYAATLDLVSHCYERPVSRKWPYSIYTMIHGRSEGECAGVIAQIVKHTGVRRYCALKTVREFKKVRVSYFA
jgi:DNA-binding Lrp family transcriptional regulator